MNWLLNHASEIAVAIIVFGATKCIDYFFAKRPKVVAFFTHGAQFRYFSGAGWSPANTMALALQNTGRAAAEQIRLVHRRKPMYYHVSPPSNPAEQLLSDGQWELCIPAILAKQTVFVSYLDGIPLDDPVLITYMASKEQVIREVRIEFARMWPKWIYFFQKASYAFSALVAVRYLYEWGAEIIRYLARR